jgi:mitochondrial fission protein ELM1
VTEDAAPIWVVDDERAGTSAQAVGIAERLGLPFRRLPLAWNWLAHLAALPRHGSLLGVAHGASWTGDQGPAIAISSGSRSVGVALWLQRRFGCRIIHCMRPQLRDELFDLLVIPQHDHPPPRPNVLAVLGAPHRVSPLALAEARAVWGDRLAHMPRPRVALLVGGPARGSDLQPALAHMLGRRVALLAAERGGSVLATTSRRTGAEATEALAAGLSRAMHLLYRWGEPGDNPYLGFLALADAIVVTADSVSMVSEAAATNAPVFVALPELASRRHRRLHLSLFRAGQARPLGDDLGPWPRRPLDEAGRVAIEIRRRFELD